MRNLIIIINLFKYFKLCLFCILTYMQSNVEVYTFIYMRIHNYEYIYKRPHFSYFKNKNMCII